MSETPPPPLPVEEAAPGTTDYAGSSGDDSKGRVFPCSRCGSDLRFHIGAQSLACDHCGHEQRLDIGEDERVSENDLEAALGRTRTQKERPAPTTVEVRCTSCGAQVTFDPHTTASECAFCGSPIQHEKAQQTSPDRLVVDGVLPFQVTKEKADANLKAWIASRWFLPNDFKNRVALGKFQGVYIPFFTFDAMTSTCYRGERGEHYYVTVGSGKNQRRERRTRWYPASGSFQRFFDDVLVCAATALPQKMVHDLEPWPLAKTQTFKPDFLAGFQAETYTKDLSPAYQEGKTRMDAAIRAEVHRRIGGDTQRIHSVNSRYGALSYKHLLLPLWLLAYRYHEKPYRVVVNAATGEVQGSRPWSVLKITLLVLTIAAIITAIIVIANN